MRTIYFALALTAISSLCSCDGGGKVSDEVKNQLKGKAAKHLRDSEQWGKVEVRTLDFANIRGIDVEGVVDVYFTQSDTSAVTLCGNERVLDAYTYDVADGVVSIKCKPETTKGTRLPVMYVYLSAPQLACASLGGVGDLYLQEPVVQDENLTVTVSGPGDVEIDGELTCNDFDITLSGPGDLDIQHVDCANSTIAVSGPGDVRIKKMKSTGDVALHISGGGDINAKVRCRNLTAEVSGSGDADINVKCDQVTATATGSGEVEIEGNAHRLIKRRGGFGALSTKKLAVDEVVTQ